MAFDLQLFSKQDSGYPIGAPSWRYGPHPTDTVFDIMVPGYFPDDTSMKNGDELLIRDTLGGMVPVRRLGVITPVAVGPMSSAIIKYRALFIMLGGSAVVDFPINPQFNTGPGDLVIVSPTNWSGTLAILSEVKMTLPNVLTFNFTQDPLAGQAYSGLILDSNSVF